MIPGLTCLEHVAYAAWLKGFSRKEATSRGREALCVVGMSDRAAIKTTQLSGGQQRRVSLAAALVHDATILLMDEPTVGLDPAERKRLRDYLNSLRATHDIVISTHQVDDLDLLADHVAVMSQGLIVSCTPTRDFLALASDAVTDAGRAELAYARVLGGIE